MVTAGLAPFSARAQSTPSATPAASPASTRSADSWFVVSAQQEGGGFTYQADVFEVYSGSTLERLGGFRAPGTTGMCVTADPSKILLAGESELRIFDLQTGKVIDVDLGGNVPDSGFWLPDPRVFQTAPPRWAFVRALDGSQAWLVDLKNATATDLMAILADPGSTPAFPNMVFAPDGDLAAAIVDGTGASIFDPQHPEKARKLDGGQRGAAASLPSFSGSGTRVVYSILSSPTATEGTILVEEVASQKTLFTIGNVSATTSAIFLPSSDDELIIMGDGEVARQSIDSAREAWSVDTKQFPYGYGFTADDRQFLFGSTEQIGGDIFWDVIDVDAGAETALDGLEGLTFYNGSYAAESNYTLFGPVYKSPSEDNVDALVGFNSDNNEVTPLVDDVSSWALSYGYSTSADGRIALFVDHDAHLMNLETGDVQTFPEFSTGSSSRGSFVSPDGSKAAISAWDTTGAGTQRIYLIDVAGGGAPELFRDGVIWMWAGGAEDKGTRARRILAPRSLA